MLSDSVTELGLAVVFHTVRIALTVMMFHGSSAVRLTARSEILSVSGQVGSDVAVLEAWAWKTSWRESSGVL